MIQIKISSTILWFQAPYQIQAHTLPVFIF